MVRAIGRGGLLLRDQRSEIVQRVLSTSADAHDLEISYIADSAATGLVNTVVTVDVVVDEIDRGGEADRLRVGVIQFEDLSQDLRFKEILQDRLIVNPVSVAKDVLEFNVVVVGYVCFSFCCWW